MYQKSTLENGICVVTETIPAQRSIAMGILVDAGPRNEAPNQTGLAHLVEHMMFSGTSSRTASQIARLIDEAGGHMGAFTAVAVNDAVARDAGAGIDAQNTAFGWLRSQFPIS